MGKRSGVPHRDDELDRLSSDELRSELARSRTRLSIAPSAKMAKPCDISGLASGEAPIPSIERRPPWWKVGVASVAGVVAGRLVFFVLQGVLTLVLDFLFGSSGWQESLESWPTLFRLALRILYWMIPLGLGQLFSTLMSGWTQTIYAAAALQTFHLVNIYADFAFAVVWLLPALIASALLIAQWAAACAEKGRAIEAKRAAVRDKH